MKELLGALSLFYIAALFIVGGIMGIISMRKANKEKHPFAAISFGFGVPALAVCAIIAIIFTWVGISVLIR